MAEVVHNKRKVRCTRCNKLLLPGEGIGWEDFWGYGSDGYRYCCEKCTEHNEKVHARLMLQEELNQLRNNKIDTWEKDNKFRSLIGQFERENGRLITVQEEIDLLNKFDHEEASVKT